MGKVVRIPGKLKEPLLAVLVEVLGLLVTAYRKRNKGVSNPVKNQ